MLKRIKDNLGIILLIIFALLVRIPHLNDSVWLDEAAQILESERPLNQQFDIINDFQPPLLHLILHFALYIDSSVIWLRTVGALIPGLITIYATYKIGTILHSKKMGLIAGALLSISSFHIFYSQELRQYSLPAMFAVLSWLEILKVTSTEEKKHVAKPFIKFSIFTILGLYASYLYPFLFLSQIVYLLNHSKRWLPHTAISTALSIVAFLPWLPTFFKQLNAGGLVRQQLPGWSEVVSVTQFKSIPLIFLKFIYGVLNVEPTPFFVITSVLLCISLLVICFKLYAFSLIRLIQENKALLIWLLIPLITSWLISFFVPVVQPKRVLYLLPAFVLFLSTFIIKVAEQKKKIIKIQAVLLFSIVCGISIFSTISYWQDVTLQRENWRALHSEVSTQFPKSQTVLMFSFPEPFASWQYYDRNNYPTFSTGTLSISNAPNISERLKTLDRYRYILVFDYLRDLTDPTDILLKELNALGYIEAQVIDYPNIGFVRVYTKPVNTLSLR